MSTQSATRPAELLRLLGDQPVAWVWVHSPAGNMYFRKRTSAPPQFLTAGGLIRIRQGAEQMWLAMHDYYRITIATPFHTYYLNGDAE